MIILRTSRIPRLVSLGAAITFLLYLCWGEDNTGTNASFNEEIKGIVDKTLDDFALQFPATNVPAKLFEIQSCLVRRAEWRAAISEPMQSTCPSLQNISLVEEICQLLPGKRLLLVGPETTHFLHSLWLDVVEARRNRTHACPGREYCTFHHICQSSSDSPEDSDSINDRAERKKKMPSDNLLRATRSALLQYTYSTTLYAGSNPSDMLYQSPQLDLETGVQQVSQYWLRRARKADLIILSRAPIPAPVSTYTLGASGNWTFASALCTQRSDVAANYCRLSLPYALASAALDMTVRKFLPSVMETIKKLATDTTYQGSLRVWHGNWIIQPSCARKGLPRETKLLPDLWSCTGVVDSCRQLDPWTYFYNAQVYLQDRILPRILPYYGIIYLPLTLPNVDQASELNDRSEYVKDCIREPWPGFPEELGQAFFSGLSALLTLKNVYGPNLPTN